MKTIFTILTSLLVFPLMGLAQINSDILVQDGTRWESGRLDFYLGLLKSRVTYEVKGDSALDNKIYKKVYADGEFYVLLREDADRNVYVRYRDKEDNQTDKEKLLYSFGLWEAGQTIHYGVGEYGDYWISEPIEASSLNSVLLENGETCKRYKNILQGIGDGYSGPLGVLHPNPDNGTRWQLLNFYHDGDLLYINEDLSASLQTYLAKDGVHWIERNSRENDPETPDPARTDYQLVHYSISGDTLLNGRSYKKLFSNGDYCLGLRVKNFFEIMRTVGDNEYLLYNFDWTQKSIAATSDAGEDFYFPMDEMKKMSQTNEGKLDEYITYCIHANPNPEGAPFYTHNKDIRLIMNVGLTSGIFSHLKLEKDHYDFTDLVCFYEGERLIYQNPVFTDSGVLLSINGTYAERNLAVLSQGSEIIFVLRNLSGKQNTHLSIYSVEGRLIFNYSMSVGSLMINNLTSGLYMYKLESGTEKIETGKFRVEK